MEELDQYTGNVWTHIISLKRENAARLSYDNAKAWMNLLRANRNDIAAAKKYGFAPRSMRRHMAELLSSGFIELESSGRITRQENLYCFSTQWRNKLANNN